MTDDELLHRIAFSQIRGLTAATALEVLDRVGGLEAFFNRSQAELWQAMGAPAKFCTDAERARVLAAARAELTFVRAHDVGVRFVADADYPRRLAQCADAPVAFYYLGKCDIFDAAHVVSLVGTRNATRYGIDFARELVTELAELVDDVVIVSGLAYGIDVSAHKAALAAGVPTAGVVAHGLNTIYPADHRDIARRMVHEGGVLATEYTSGSQIHRGNFLARNRIVAGLSDAVIVVESDARGGALSTARIASGYDRLVGAVPGRVTDRYSRGCNALLASQTATIIRSAEDLVAAMNWATRPREGQQTELVFDDISPEFQQVIDHLRAHPDATLNDMVAALGIPYGPLSARLMQMEMADLLASNPGGSFRLNV